MRYALFQLLWGIFLAANWFSPWVGVCQAQAYLIGQKGPYLFFPDTVGESSSRLNFNLSQFSTQSLYDDQGEALDLTDDQSYDQLDFQARYHYGIRQNFDWILALATRQVKSVGANHDAANFGLESVSAGLKYSFPKTYQMNFGLEGEYFYRAYSNGVFPTLNDVPNDEVSLGSGENMFRFLINAHWRISRSWGLGGFGGLQVHSGDQSQEIPFLAEAVWVSGEWALRGGVEGIQSLKTDTFTDSPQTKPLTGQQISKMHSGVNSTYALPYLGINYAFTPDSFVSFKIGQVMRGFNYDGGMYAGLNLSFRMNRTKSKEQVIDEAFKDYAIEAYVTKISPRGRFLKIDRGLTNDIQKGMRFDIFKSDAFGTNILVASGVVYEVEASSAVVQVIKLYRKIPIQEGFVVRGRDN